MAPRMTAIGRPMPVGRLIVFAFAVVLLVVVPIAVAETDPSPPPPDADARRFDGLVVPPAAASRSPIPATPRDWRPGLTWEHVVYWAPGEDDLDLYSMDAGGLIGWRLTAGPANEAQPALNQTGTRLAYISDADGDYDLYVADYQWDGALGAPVNLSNNNVDDYWPSWSPDGTRIAYYSEIDNQADIFVARVNGGPPVRLTADPAFDGFPSWSPDGARIAFSSWRGGGYRIHVMNADGANVIRLSQQPGSVFPAWSRDGARIAYSADYTIDGWLEGMIMNADGSGQTLVIDKPGPSEPQMRAWSLDGEMVYTTVNYIQYQGRWFIESAYVAAWSMAEGYERRLKMDTGYGFDPSWERVDTLAPESAVAPLPATSPAPITVNWSGRDNGPSTIASYDVQFRRDGGDWTDWLTGTTDTTATKPGRGGATYAFRVRATDWAGNVEPWPATPDGVTTVEALAPQSNLKALPRFHPANQSLTVRWSGQDFGGSGIRGYSVRFAPGEPPWMSWLVDVPYLSETFFPRVESVAPGDTLTFQMRAVDQAYNEEPWPAGGQTTTFYGWGINGRVTDHTGVPIGGATATTDPPALASLPSDAGGNYAAYTVEAGAPATVTWARDGYGPLPPVTFPTLADAARDVVLPPADNTVANGDFAAGATGWQAGGSFPPQMTGGAALLGRASSWSEPATLPMSGISVQEEPRVFVDGSGAAVALWIGRYVEGHTPQTYWARRGPDGAWSNSALLVPNGRSFDGARDAAGRLHLLVTGNEVTYLRQEGAGWTASQVVAAPEVSAAMGRGDDARLVIGPDGTLHALWVARREPGLDFEAALYHAQLPPGGRWSAPETVYRDTLDVRDLDLVPLPDGSLHLIWIMQRPGAASYYLLSQRRVAGQWLEATELAVGGTSASFAVSAAPGGRVYLLYSVAVGQRERSGTYFRVAQGDVWGAPERLTPAAGDVLALDVTPGGEVRALTLAGELSFWQRPPGGEWSARLLAATFSAEATMTTTPGGETHVVWRSFPGGSITYARVLANGVRQSPIVLSPPDAIGSPAVDAGPDGAAHVVWLDGSPAVETVYSGPAVLPAIAAGQSTLTQEVTSPSSAYPVLSFVYETGGPDGAPLQLLIDGAARSLPATPNGPRHYVLDLPGAGTRVLTFRLTMPAGRAAAWATIDDVSLGGARPDVWVRGHSAPGLPGETVVHTLEIGNRGRAPAADVVLSYVLPASLTYTKAEPPPDGLSPLRWDIGALAPDQTVVVRLETEVGSGPLFGSVTSTATVEVAPGTELELLNNTAGVVTWLARGVYLPWVLR